MRPTGRLAIAGEQAPPAPRRRVPVAEDDVVNQGVNVEARPRYGGRILVIDDEEGVRTVAALSLRKRGFDVVTASDGEEGRTLVMADEVTRVLECRKTDHR